MKCGAVVKLGSSIVEHPCGREAKWVITESASIRGEKPAPPIYRCNYHFRGWHPAAWRVAKLPQGEPIPRQETLDKKLLRDPKKMFLEMLGQWSYVPSAWANIFVNLKIRVEKNGWIEHLTDREIEQISRAYESFKKCRGPRFVQGGAPGLGKRSR